MATSRLRSFGLLAALVLATLAVSHHLVYLVAHGTADEYARAMSAAGHDAYWADFLVAVGGTALIAIAFALRELRRLTRLAGAIPPGGSVQDAGYGRLLRLWGPVFAKVAIATTAAFLVQENAEILSVGKGLPGLGVIAGDHAIAVPVILLVAAAMAVVRALVQWRRDILLARIRRQARPRAGVVVLRPSVAIGRPHSSLDGSRNGERAPPAGPLLPA